MLNNSLESHIIPKFLTHPSVFEKNIENKI